MPVPLKTLLVADVPEVAGRLFLALEHAGFSCECRRVACEAEYLAAIEDTPDIVFAAYDASFPVLRALELLHTRRPGLPLIVLCDTIGEENAIACVKAGASDCILWNRLQRLGPAVHQALKDATEKRKRAEAALLQGEARFREFAEAIGEVFWISNPARNQLLYVSPAYERIWGSSCQSAYDNPSSWLEVIHEADRERVMQASVLCQTAGSYNEEYRIVRPDGKIRWIRDRAFSVRNDSGQIDRIIGVAQDVTEHRALEEQFRQSQKLEAIGLLAGGVAHDFNNILSAIMMQLGIIRNDIQVPPNLEEALEELEDEVRRAAAVTRQLLLFSRRQVLQPKDLDLNEAVTGLARMLQRMIGEDVRLQLDLHGTPLITRVDAAMLDQVLLNLAVNARDAMPSGGRLRIETSERMVDDTLAGTHPDAQPGQYVSLNVTDNGTGMAPEILPRIFEPFFTTKDPGKGTGLGLATVFGIVKQHFGWINVRSEPGQGTTFEVFLPASKNRSVAAQTVRKRLLSRGGTETILLVEDETSVRTLTRMTLERAGYHVLEAAHGVEALEIWKKEGHRIQLLFTDMVMPEGFSGLELARQLQASRPELKVVFSSGYNPEIAGRELVLNPGQNFIQKPCSSEELLAAVRHSLDG